MKAKLDFNNVLIEPCYTMLDSRKKVNLKVKYKMRECQDVYYEGIPIIATNMSTVGTIDTAKALQKMKLMTWLHKFSTNEIINASIDNELDNNKVLNKNNFAITIGMGWGQIFDWGFNKLNLVEYIEMVQPKFVVIDVANGYMQKYLEFVYSFKQRYPNIAVIAGTVCTKDGTSSLFEAGASIVRIGVGSGSHCLTRVNSGVGYPQFSALLESREIAEKCGGYLVCDGGATNPGDVAKAFVAGAHFVSIGSMFAAHKENTDEIITENGKKFAKVYGMSSFTAMEKYYGKVNSYRTSEGRTTLTPYRGPIKNTVNHILGGLRSACTYTNSQQLSVLRYAKWNKVMQTHSVAYQEYTIGM